MKIERDKFYKDRCGDIWRVVCVDAPGDFPVFAHRLNAQIFSGRNICIMYRFTAQGRNSQYQEIIQDVDLVEECTPPANSDPS